jgi:hypothetical protein
MLNKALSAGFIAWTEWSQAQSELLAKQEKLTARIANRTISVGFATWLAWSRFESDILQRREKLKARMLNKAIAAGFQTWVSWLRMVVYHTQQLTKLVDQMRKFRAFTLSQALHIWWRNGDEAARVRGRGSAREGQPLAAAL